MAHLSSPFLKAFLFFIFLGKVTAVCKETEFHCNNNLCISKTLVCDKENDCGDNSDEEICQSSPCVFGACSQVCTEKKFGNYSCHCAPGFTMTIAGVNTTHLDKNRTCFAYGKIWHFKYSLKD